LGCNRFLLKGRDLSLSSAVNKIRVGHSPDADDAFMFYAIAHGKIPLDGLEVEHVIEDIESLNQRAFSNELEVTALSCHAYAHVSDRYQLLPYGASVGEGYGPIVVGRGRGNVAPSIVGRRVAVPGQYTTAYLVLRLYEADFEPIFVPFEKVFQAVEEGKADFGLLIHEGQLTYQEKGFLKIVDLGEWWNETQRLPLPLGVNAIRRDLDEGTKKEFASLFLQSIQYAMAHRDEAIQYALKFGRGIDSGRGDKFVGMYVNEYSLGLDKKVRRALQVLYELAWKKRLLPAPVTIEVLG
jgi:1,4-dihydroxy-6-naphthoate synthase